MKILILKPSSLGDVVQALPVLRLLRRHFPASEIHWWLDSRLLTLLEGDPDLAGVVPFERRRWAALRHWPEMFRSIRWLRSQKFDWVIDLQGLARSGTFAWLANGGLLAGLDEVREGARGFYDLTATRASYGTHAVDWYLSLLPRLGVPVDWDFNWLPERSDVAQAVHVQGAGASADWIALLPGARWMNKRWPAAHFAALVQQLAAHDPKLRFVVLGGAEDRDAGRFIVSAEPQRCRDMVGKTTLPEVVEWLRLCRLVVSNDTGPMHIAAALGRPVVAVFGPTDPRRTGPYGQLGHVVQDRTLACVPCMKSECRFRPALACLHGVTPELIARRIRERLAQPSPNSEAVVTRASSR